MCSDSQRCLTTKPNVPGTNVDIRNISSEMSNVQCNIEEVKEELILHIKVCLQILGALPKVLHM